MSNFLNIGKPVTKIDALSLATGMEKFAADHRIENVLHVAFLYSPHAHAEIVSLDPTEAEKVPGVALVLHHGNVPRVLHTTAGQGYPEPSPYDTALFDRRMRFVGDRVALVAADTLEAAQDALEKVRVEYNVLEPVLDAEKAQDPASPRLHGEDAFAPLPVVYKPEINLAAEAGIEFGDITRGFAEADFVEEGVFRTQYASHCAIEPHAVQSWYDERGRLVILTTTQVPFHVRRITGRVLDIPIGRIRVIKPRIGGGFGGKQEVFLEPLAALVTQRTRRPARIVLSRREVFVSARTRHPMRMRVKIGAKNDGRITALEMEGLMNTGAYGSHALTVMSNAGSKILPLLNKVENVRFLGKTVYTNLPVGGAYRGYGATQGYFGFCQVMDDVARHLGVDLVDYYKQWHIREGETSEVFRVLGEGKEGVAQIIRSCKLDECLDRGSAAIGWSEKRGKRIRSGDRVKGIGLAVCMQGSGIPKVDMAAASMKMNEDGSFNLFIGATDLGTGSDTILAQIAAETLQVPVEKLIVLSSDTDLTPFDVGAYASSTTYVSGGAVLRCAQKVRDILLRVGASIQGADVAAMEITPAGVRNTVTGTVTPLERIGYYTFYENDQFQVAADASYYGTESPAPFMAQFADVDVDTRTGRIHVVKYVTAIDCGRAIHPLLAQGQVEGAVVNGLSYALWENYDFDAKGRMQNASFWDYKLFTAADLPEMVTLVVDSDEETGPYGAKSVSEIGINGPLPAIANAVFDAVGVRLREAPFTPERLWRLLKEK